MERERIDIENPLQSGFNRVSTIQWWNNANIFFRGFKDFYESEYPVIAAQSRAIEYIKDNIFAIHESSLKLAIDYYAREHSKWSLSDFQNEITPRYIQFEKDGSFALFCDETSNPDDGIVIVLFQKMEVASQDEYL